MNKKTTSNNFLSKLELLLQNEASNSIKSKDIEEIRNFLYSQDKQDNHLELKSKAYSIVHNFYRNKNKHTELNQLIETMLPYFTYHDDKSRLYRMYFDWSILKRMTGDYEKSLEYIKNAIEYARNIEDNTKMANSLNSLANIYLETGEYNLALENYYKSFQFIKNSKSLELYYLVKQNLAHMYVLLNYFDKAKELYMQDLDTIIKEENYERCGASMQGVAEIYSEQNNTFLAYKYAKRSMEYWYKTTNERGIANALSTFGKILSKYGKHKEAIDFFIQSRDLFETLAYKNGLINAHFNLGTTYFEIKDNDKAVENLEKAMEIAIETKLNFELRKIYDILYKVYEIVGREKESFEILKKLTKLNDTIFNFSLQVKVNELQVNFELEKKELEYNKEREINDYKNNLFSYLTHEFRTPLTLINTPLEMIEHEYDVNLIRNSISFVKLQVEQMQKLLNQLLDINKIDEGKMPINKKIGGLLPMLWHLVSVFENEMRSKNLGFKYQLPRKDVQGYFDIDKIEKIITNLLINAIKYSHDGGKIELNIAIEKNELKISVKDNGIGIAKKYHNDIFNKFFRIPDNNKMTGSGLGLSFVKELTDLLEGNITLESEENVGTEFIITIPFEKIEQEFNNKMVVHEEVIEEEEDVSKKQVVLIVEDNVDIQKLLKDIFREKYRIMSALNGKEALAQIEKRAPDIIISDVIMPIMNGVELCKKIKENDNLNHIPIILLSAKSQVKDRIEGIESGADAYLSKPFNLDELKFTVESMLNQRKKILDKFSSNIFHMPDEDLVSADRVLINRATEYTLDNLSNENLSVIDLANYLNMSRFTLIRKFKMINNLTPNNFIQKIRLEKSKEFLKNKVANVSEIAFKVGFASTTYFSSSFKREYGMTPKEFINVENE